MPVALSIKAQYSDAWIATKVKSVFMFSTGVNGSDLVVNVDGGVVALSGKVDCGAEQAMAIRLARNIRGVKSVQSKDLAF